MAAETSLLSFPVRLVVIIIETGLADGDDARVMACGDKRRGVGIGMFISFMRVNADTGPNTFVRVGNADHAVPLAFPAGNGEKAAHPGAAGAGQHTGHIFAQAGVVEVAMAVDQHDVRHLQLLAA